MDYPQLILVAEVLFTVRRKHLRRTAQASCLLYTDTVLYCSVFAKSAYIILFVLPQLPVTSAAFGHRLLSAAAIATRVLPGQPSVASPFFNFFFKRVDILLITFASTHRDSYLTVSPRVLAAVYTRKAQFVPGVRCDQILRAGQGEHAQEAHTSLRIYQASACLRPSSSPEFALACFAHDRSVAASDSQPAHPTAPARTSATPDTRTTRGAY